MSPAIVAALWIGSGLLGIVFLWAGLALWPAPRPPRPLRPSRPDDDEQTSG
jgi:hypothetical protein